MASSGSKYEQDILDLLALHGSVRVSELAGLLGVSDQTVRRVVRPMAESGALRKAHGSIMRAGATGDPPFVTRMTIDKPAKLAIAGMVAELIGDGYEPCARYRLDHRFHRPGAEAPPQPFRRHQFQFHRQHPGGGSRQHGLFRRHAAAQSRRRGVRCRGHRHDRFVPGGLRRAVGFGGRSVPGLHGQRSRRIRHFAQHDGGRRPPDLCGRCDQVRPRRPSGASRTGGRRHPRHRLRAGFRFCFPVRQRRPLRIAAG